MSSKNIHKNMLPPHKSTAGEAKIQRLLGYLDLKSKVDLAQYLGKSAQAINSAQIRNNIPDAWIDRIAATRGCSAAELRKFVDTGRPMGQQQDYNRLIAADVGLRQLVDIWQAIDPLGHEVLQGMAMVVSRGGRLVCELLVCQVRVVAELLRSEQQERSTEDHLTKAHYSTAGQRVIWRRGER